jgi:hypothetical protein
MQRTFTFSYTDRNTTYNVAVGTTTSLRTTREARQEECPRIIVMISRFNQETKTSKLDGDM